MVDVFRIGLVLLISATVAALMVAAAVRAAPTSLPTELDVIQAVTAGGAVPDRERLIGYAEQIMAGAGESLDGLVRAGIAWQMAGENEKALAAYEKALALDPEPVDLYQRIAAVAPEGIQVYAFGRKVEFPDVVPFIRDGRTLVPIRAIAEALGAKVEWDPERGAATIRVGETFVEITRDSRIARVGDGTVELDVPATIVPPGRFVVPLRFVAEAFGHRVLWHGVLPGVNVISITERPAV